RQKEASRRGDTFRCSTKSFRATPSHLSESPSFRWCRKSRRGRSCSDRRRQTDRRRASVHRDSDRAGHLSSEEREAPIKPVPQSNRNAITPIDSKFLQSAGDSRRAIPKLAIVDALSAQLDDGFVIGRLVDGCSQHFNKRVWPIIVMRDAA